MKAVIFAGGVGTRLWPLSRKKSPKQFEKIIDGKSTLQLAVERLFPFFKPQDIFIATEAGYVELASRQIQDIPKENFLGEPVRRDVGPAVALVMGYLNKLYGQNEPVFISWSDHLVKQVKKFQIILSAAEKIIKEENDKIVFVGQKPRFASVNLGYIQYGEILKKINGVNLHKFVTFKYKPNEKTANKYFKDGKHCWNLGYFVTTPKFMLRAYKNLVPQIYRLIQKIMNDYGKKTFEKNLEKYYTQMPIIHLDNAILEQLNPHDAYVAVEDIGWSDVGAWEALKEALEKEKSDNITNGRVYLENSRDNLIFNYEDKKLIVGIDLDDYLIVNANDVLLVTKKSSVSKIKKLVESLKGSEYEELT